MKLLKPENENYAATVVALETKMLDEEALDMEEEGSTV